MAAPGDCRPPRVAVARGWMEHLARRLDLGGSLCNTRHPQLVSEMDGGIRGRVSHSVKACRGAMLSRNAGSAILSVTRPGCALDEGEA